LNYFFGIKSAILDSKLTIPRFKNRDLTKKKYKLFQLEISNQMWEISKLDIVDSNSDFYEVDSSIIANDKVFFLATENDVLNFRDNNGSKLRNMNDYSDTSPDYRANLQVSIKDGGFSSYQSEYPYSMVTKRGGVISSLSSLCSKSADWNVLFLKNIYELPIHEEFGIYFVNFKTKEVLKKEVGVTNFLNEIAIEKELIEPEIFLVTDKYIGVPVYCSIQNKHISFEHTHPPHEYIMSKDRFGTVSQLKKEFNEIIN